MKSNLESVSKLGRRLSIEVPQQSVKEAFDRAYRSIQKHATIKGFRPGKAPIATIRSLYQDRVKQDVIQDLVQKHYIEALGEHALHPITMPDIEVGDISDEQDFSFTAQFEVRPNIELKQIEGLTIEKEKLVIDEERINKSLENIRENRADLKPILEERPAQKGDFAILDFKGIVDGQPLENGEAKDYTLELGSNTFIPGFEDGVLGMKPGSKRTINLQFPEDYQAKEIAGKPVTFEVELKEIKKKSLPKLDDEFAKSLGQFTSLDQLRDEIRKELEDSEKRRIEDELKTRVLKALVEKNPVEVPATLLNDQKASLVQDFEQRLKSQGMNDQDFAEYREKWNDDFEDTAKFMIQSAFLLEQIAEEKQLKVSEADLEAKFDEMAKQTGLEKARIREFYGSGERRSKLRYQLLENKVVDFLISKATVTEVEPELLKKDTATENA